MGGIFYEGIDLTGDRLSGALVIGLCKNILVGRNKVRTRGILERLKMFSDCYDC